MSMVDFSQLFRQLSNIVVLSQFVVSLREPFVAPGVSDGRTGRQTQTQT